MAKSLRSKWRRKCRAVKRIRYGQKELERLKKMLGLTEPEGGRMDVDGVTQEHPSADSDNTRESTEPEEAWIELLDVGKQTLSLDTDLDNTETPADPNEKQIETVSVGKRRFNPRTMKDQYGSYPAWMHPRKIRKQKKLQKKKK